MSRKFLFISVLVILALAFGTTRAGAGTPMGTSFTFQGKIRSTYTGNCDMIFSLWDASSGGSQIGGTIARNRLTLTSGAFTTVLDFGSGAIIREQRWVEVRARCPSSLIGLFVNYGRMKLEAVPYALVALDATNALDADLLDGAHGAYYLNAGNINAGTLGTDYYSAVNDLDVEGILSNAYGGIAQNNSVLQEWLNADLLDNYHAAAFALVNHYHYYLNAADGVPTNALNVDNDGRVGIGTTSPGVTLDVAGPIRTTHQFISTQPGGTPPLVVSSNTLVTNLNADMLDGLHSSAFATSGHYHFSLNAADGSPTNAVYVDNDGKVGIGTTVFNSAANFQVGQAGVGQPSAFVFGTLDRDPSNLNNIPQFTTYLYGGPPGTTARYGMGHYYGLAFSAYEDDLGDPHYGVIRFYTGGDGQPMAERMRIGYEGNVGIGTMNPGVTLDVAGPIRTTHQFISTQPSSEPPLVVSSTSKVVNLNADVLDGFHAGNAAGNIPLNNSALNTNLNADRLDGQDGVFYQSASNIIGGTLDTNRFSAYSDLNVDGYLGNANGDLAMNTGVLQDTLNADLLDGSHASAFALASHAHSSLNAADGDPTNAVYVDNDGKVGIGTTVFNSLANFQVGQAGVGQPSILVFGQVDRDPSNLTNIPQYATYLYGGPPGITARYGMGHYYGLAFSAYEDDLGDPHMGVIKFFTGGDGLPLAERMRLDYAGNLGIGVTNPIYPIQLASGAYVSAGGVWTNSSDKNAKENIARVNNVSILEKIGQLSISQWNYKAEQDGVQHIGPMAQDFYAAFSVGADDTHISTIDADGVALAGIQALYAQNKQQDTRLAALEKGGSPSGLTNSPWIIATVLLAGIVIGQVLPRRKREE
jgi:hypothetical protein